MTGWQAETSGWLGDIVGSLCISPAWPSFFAQPDLCMNFLSWWRPSCLFPKLHRAAFLLSGHLRASCLLFKEHFLSFRTSEVGITEHGDPGRRPRAVEAPVGLRFGTGCASHMRAAAGAQPRHAEAWFNGRPK